MKPFAWTCAVSEDARFVSILAAFVYVAADSVTHDRARFGALAACVGVFYACALRAHQVSFEVHIAGARRAVAECFAWLAWVLFCVGLCVHASDDASLYAWVHTLPLTASGAVQIAWTLAVVPYDKRSWFWIAYVLFASVCIVLSAVNAHETFWFNVVLVTQALFYAAVHESACTIQCGPWTIWAFLCASFTAWIVAYCLACTPAGACQESRLYSLSGYVRFEPSFAAFMCVAGTIYLCTCRYVQVVLERGFSKWLAVWGWVTFAGWVIFLPSTAILDDGWYWLHRVSVGVSAVAGLVWSFMRFKSGPQFALAWCTLAFVTAMFVVDGLYFGTVFPHTLQSPATHVYSAIEAGGLMSMFALHTTCLFHVN